MTSILIVDDEEQNLIALHRELTDRSPSWTVLKAKDEAEAAALLAQHDIDAVVTDLVMATDQSGMEVLQTAKSRDPWIMVILITAFEKRLDRYRAFELGAFDCVQKNTPGVIAVEEIFVKLQAAIRFRGLALQQIDNERRFSFLGRYFDPRVFSELQKNPELLALRHDTVTICFWDIRGFSKLSEILKAYPNLIAGFLTEYFGEAAKIIFDNHGVLDKFIGDGIMGLFGAVKQEPNDGTQDALDAVATALALKERFHQILSKWLEQWALYTPQKIDIGLGCGIHTGDVLVGKVGTELRDQYTALGPNVNFAQRIETRAGIGEILLSASTRARLGTRFKLEDAGLVNDIKNIPGEFKLFAVIGASN